MTDNSAPANSAQHSDFLTDTSSGEPRPLRILQVVHRFLPELGGTETHVAQVTQRLQADSALDITILTTDRSGELPAHEVVNGVPVVRRRAWPRKRDYYFSPGMISEIKNGHWDLIHFQGIHTLVPVLGMLAARRAKIPYVVTFHSGGHSSAGRTAARGPQFKALTPLLRRAAKLIAVSRFERTRFSAATGIAPENFVVVGNGGSLPPAAENEHVIPWRIVSSGRLERYKGHHRAIEAMPKILAQQPDASLLILGSGPYEDELRALTAKLGLEKSVEIAHLPPADRSAMSRELARASVMAALSSYEAHPVGVMEAVAGGLPVLGFDIAGIGDLVEDGLVEGISAEADSSEIATALLTLMTISQETTTRVRPDVELPTWESCTESLTQVYQQICPRSVATTGVTR